MSSELDQRRKELIGRAVQRLLEKRRRNAHHKLYNLSLVRLDDGSIVSTKDRLFKNVNQISNYKPIDSQIFFNTGLPNINFIKQHFFNQGKLTEYQVLTILNYVIEIIEQESNLLELDASILKNRPITIVGDIHGQYYDLLTLFEKNGEPSDENPYLFLGDYVDRGYFSFETLILLYCYKLTYPNSIYLLRGNHESEHLTSYFTFRKEVFYKYHNSASKIYEMCCSSFNSLPLAAILDKRYFCCHGGISPDLINVQDLNRIDRYVDTPSNGIMCDILWSDPVENYDDEDNDTDESTFIINTDRGCSFAYTFKSVDQFLQRNNLIGIIRAHQAQSQGFKLYRKTKIGCPSIITLFSAPNYVDRYKNKAAYIKYHDNVMDIKQFAETKHPYMLPNFKDVFSWSLPFIGQNITNILLAILNICITQEDYDNIEGLSLEEIEAIDKTEKILQAKVKSIGRISRLYQILKTDDEFLTILKFNNHGILPKGLLMGGSAAINDYIYGTNTTNNNMDLDDDKTTAAFKEIDKFNEGFPPTIEDVRQHELAEEKYLFQIINE